MNRIKLLIADSDVRFVDLVCKYMKNFPDIEIVACEQNGQDALRCIRNLHPHAVLFDMVLPGLDGISLLRSASALRNSPAMICCTRFYSDVALEAMRAFGAAYLLFKPVELQALHPAIASCAELHQKMRRLSHEFEDSSSDTSIQSAKIRNYIISLGIPAKLVGCNYLTEAVRLAHRDITLTHNLSKGLYLEIARNMNSTPTRIERCIRKAISTAYQTGGLDAKLISSPSNKEFIAYVLRTIDL